MASPTGLASMKSYAIVHLRMVLIHCHAQRPFSARVVHIGLSASRTFLRSIRLKVLDRASAWRDAQEFVPSRRCGQRGLFAS